jgi:hypothetical protein
MKKEFSKTGVSDIYIKDDDKHYESIYKSFIGRLSKVLDLKL